MTNSPKTKYYLFSAMVLMAAAPQIASAQTSEPLADLYACEGVADKDDQLACFLAATAQLRRTEASVLTIAPSVRASEAPARAADNPREVAAVGKESAPAFNPNFGKKGQGPKERTSVIASTSTFGADKFVRFTLDNGEVWQQTEPGRFRLGKSEPDMLTLKRASMGSFFARVNGKRPSIRVKQVK